MRCLHVKQRIDGALAAAGQPGVLFVGALGLLLAVRVAPIIAANFPIGDGGLFTVMARDLRATGFALPAFTSYNDGTIPFVYPPLGIYLLALIPGDPIQTERWLPLVYSLLSIGAAALLARELVGVRAAAVAVLAFAAMPITWALEGGGVTRGLAFALLLLALWRVTVLLRSPSIRNAALAGVPAGLALLSHPSVGPSLVVSAVVFLVARYSSRGAVGLVAAGLIAAAVALPWLVVVLSQHGPEPFLLAVGAHGQSPAILRLLAIGPSWLGSLDPILPAALVGAAIAYRRRMWLVPAWLVVLFLVPGGDGRYAALAWAILASLTALVIFEALLPLGAHRIAAVAILGLLFVASLRASYQSFQPVAGDVRAAMVAEARNAAPGITFSLVPAGPDDPALEWFPALTGRSNATTYFGYEWTKTWYERVGLYDQALQAGSPRP
jgi:dolichyl-phosphate-mannose-protein mannosyltransferase